MYNIKTIFETTSFATLGAAIGYASALLLSTISPLAGAINGFSFVLIMSKTGENIAKLNREEWEKSSIKDKMVYLVTMANGPFLCISASTRSNYY